MQNSFFIRVILPTLLICLLPFLTGSSSFYPRLLKQWASENIRPYVNLYRAHSLGDTQAAELLSTLAKEHDYHHWQRLLAQQGIAEAQFVIASQSESSAEKQYLLREAAADNHPQALYELGMLVQNSQQKEHYLSQSAKLGWAPARSALYQWLWMQGKYEEAIPWMLEMAESDQEVALRLGQCYGKQAEYQQGQMYLKTASSLNSQKATAYLQLIEQFWQKDSLSADIIGRKEHCKMRLQFVATGLDSALQAQTFKLQFEQDPQMRQLPICVNSLFWTDQKQLPCHSQAVNNYRISCRLERLDGLLQPDDFSHLVVFHSRGKANVKNGVMYLDLADKYSVFIHELAHFVGFVDEYPISSTLADYYCQPDRYYPNIFVLEQDADLNDVSLEPWQSYQESISIVKARTCNNHPNTAYKLSGKMTFMEFHDSDFIPPLYLAIWQERLLDPLNTKPAALDIAQALEDIGNSPAAQKWWLRFHQWRTL